MAQQKRLEQNFHKGDQKTYKGKANPTIARGRHRRQKSKRGGKGKIKHGE